MLWLVGQLPEGSAFYASVQGGSQHRGWTTERHLQAAMVNLLYSANMQRGGKKVKKLPVEPPKPSIKARRAARRGRVVRLADMPGARRVAGR